MKCQFCDNDATVHLQQIKDEETQEMHLCESCAEERGITDPDGFSLASMLGDKEDQVKVPEIQLIPECDECGFSLEDLKKVGRLGCSSCYSAFNSEISAMLDSMHRGVIHLGKRPEGMICEVLQQEKIDSVEQALQLAIENEDFELAAKLRDELNSLKVEGKS